jgi:hypothetical protein
MAGIKINDPSIVLKNLKLEPKATSGDFHKYKTNNGNDLSITSENGKIVYIENDWLHGARGLIPLYSDFEFGKTSLDDIRNKFGTNGFSYNKTALVSTETDVIMFNCFEFDSPNKEILVMVTKIPLEAKANLENIGRIAKLDAVILAKKEYLDKIWGTKKVYDPNYKKIKN